MDITLRNGAESVVIRDARQSALPTSAGRLEVLSCPDGERVAYLTESGDETVQVGGRVLTRSDAEQIVAWRHERTLLVLEDRDGSETEGWRIDPSGLSLRRKDGESNDYLVAVNLYRL